MKKLYLFFLICITHNFLFSMEVESKNLVPFLPYYQVHSACFNKAGTELLTLQSIDNSASICIRDNGINSIKRVKVQNDYCCGVATFNEAETKIIVNDYVLDRVSIYARDKNGIHELFSDTIKGFVCFNKKETEFVTRSFDEGKLCIWNAETQQELFVVLYKHPFISACFNEKETEIVTMASDGMMQVWDRNSAKELLRCKHDFAGLTGKSVSFNKQGTEILVCGASPVVHVWDRESGKVSITLEHPEKAICARFNCQGNEICTMAIDGNIRIWDKKTGNIVARFPVPSFFVNSLEWSSDGKKIVATFGDCVHIWPRYVK